MMVEKRRTSARFKKETPAKRKKTEAPHVEKSPAPVVLSLPCTVGETETLPVIERYASAVDRALQSIAER